MTLIGLFIALLLRRTLKIVLAIMVLTFVSILLFYMFHFPPQGVIIERILSDDSAGRYSVIPDTAPPEVNASNQSVFIHLMNYSPEKDKNAVSLPMDVQGPVKPVYRDTESIQNTTINFILEDNTRTKIRIGGVMQDNSFIFRLY